MFGSIGTTELILILAIVLLIFGVGKLPEVFKALGSGVREFRDAANDEPTASADATDATANATADAAPVAPAAPAAAAPPAATTDTSSDAS